MQPHGRRRAVRGLGSPQPSSEEHQCPGEGIVGAAGGCPDGVHGGVLVEARCQTGLLAPQVVGRLLGKPHQ